MRGVEARVVTHQVIGRCGATAAVASGLVVGSIAGGYVISQAASAPSATASPSAGSRSATAPRDHGDRSGFAGARPEARTQDLQQVAGAIGITATQLQTEMTAGCADEDDDAAACNRRGRRHAAGWRRVGTTRRFPERSVRIVDDELTAPSSRKPVLSRGGAFRTFQRCAR